jgi:hypothetical protein
MYDAVTASNIPGGATMVAGYDDGRYVNVAEMAARFPRARVVTITVFASDDEGMVLDVERGDASPEEAPGWAARRRARGFDPSVYCSTDTWPAVRAAFAAAGVAEPHWWIAGWDGDPAIPPGAVAKQYGNQGPYDISSVADYWPGVDPVPTPPSHPQEETDMPQFTIDPGQKDAGVTFARGRYSTVGFFCDNTFTGGPADPGAQLRVVLWATGTAPVVRAVAVSNKDSGQAVVSFPLPASTHSVTVSREDGGRYRVFAEVS